MVRQYRWSIPLKALRIMNERLPSNFFTSRDIATMCNSLSKHSFSSQSVAKALNYHHSKGVVDKKKSRVPGTLSGKIEVNLYRVVESEEA